MRASGGPGGREGVVHFLMRRCEGVAANRYEISLGVVVVSLLLGGAEPNRNPAGRSVVRDPCSQPAYGFEQIEGGARPPL
jgi:hypothetical protein